MVMRKLILITASLLMSIGVYAEQRVCELKGFEFNLSTASLEVASLRILSKLSDMNCKSGDILTWDMTPTDVQLRLLDEIFARHTVSRAIVSMHCHQEKQITTSEDLALGVCTWTGNQEMFKR